MYDRPDSTIRFRRVSSRAGRHRRLHALPTIQYAPHCTSPLMDSDAAGMARSGGRVDCWGDLRVGMKARRCNVNTSAHLQSFSPVLYLVDCFDFFGRLDAVLSFLISRPPGAQQASRQARNNYSCARHSRARMTRLASKDAR